MKQMYGCGAGECAKTGENLILEIGKGGLWLFRSEHSSAPGKARRGLRRQRLFQSGEKNQRSKPPYRCRERFFFLGPSLPVSLFFGVFCSFVRLDDGCRIPGFSSPFAYAWTLPTRSRCYRWVVVCSSIHFSGSGSAGGSARYCGLLLSYFFFDASSVRKKSRSAAVARSAGCIDVCRSSCSFFFCSGRSHLKLSHSSTVRRSSSACATFAASTSWAICFSRCCLAVVRQSTRSVDPCSESFLFRAYPQITRKSV